MMRPALAAALAALTLAACQKPEPAAPTPAPVVATSLEGWTAYGTPSADTTTVLPVDDAAAAPEEYAGRTIQISGTVHEVCQSEGCWATLSTPTGIVRITLPEDSTGAHLFTLPKDISGRRIIAEGTLDEATVSAEHARHLADDAKGGQHAEHGAGHDMSGGHNAPADTSAPGATTELRLKATGVLVKNG